MKRSAAILVLALALSFQWGCSKNNSPTSATSSNYFFSTSFYASYPYSCCGGAPTGVVVSNGLVYSVDIENEVVDVFDEQGNLINYFGNGCCYGSLQTPCQIAFDPQSGNLAVGDYDEGVLFYSQTGTFVGYGTYAGYPSGIAFDTNGNYYVYDPDINSIVSCNENGCSSTITGSQYGFESADIFMGITVDKNNNLWVPSGDYNHLLEFSTSPNPVAGESAVMTAEKTVVPVSPASLEFATDMKVLPNGNLMVLDAESELVDQFSPNGTLLQSFSNTGGASGFETPFYMALDPSNNLYVSDIDSGYISIFNP